MSTQSTPTRCNGSRGAALIVVLFFLVFMLSLSLVFARQMQTEAVTAGNAVSQTQARLIAMGVIEAIKADLQSSIDAGDEPSIDFVESQAVVMGDGMYWIVAHDFTTDEEPTYAVVPESSRVNISVTPPDRLAALPGMNTETANAIADWRDADDEVRDGGAESDYYLAQRPGYDAKNSRFETIEELLLVRDIDPTILFGEDANRNGVLDPNENDAAATPPADNADGKLDVGAYPYLTIYSAEPNKRPNGEDRVNINQGGAIFQLLREKLEQKRFDEVSPRVPGSRPFRNGLDFAVKLKLTDEEFGELENEITTDNQPVRRGVIDVMSAPAEVLDLLPGLEVGDGQRIVAARSSEGESMLWLVDALGEEKAIQAAGLLTTDSYQYSADIVAVSGDGRGFVRYRVVFDTLSSNGEEIDKARVVYFQDITNLGWPIDPQVRVALREGTPIDEVAELYKPGVR
ncbi:MAG: type II secretion system protein GspK [Phycisphaerales bacterium]